MRVVVGGGVFARSQPCPLAPPGLGCLLHCGLDLLGFLGGGPAIQPSLFTAALQSGPPEALSRRTLTVTRVNTPKHSPGAAGATAYSALSRQRGCTRLREGRQVSLGRTGARLRGGGVVPGNTPQPSSCEAPLELLSPSGAIPATKPPAPVPTGRLSGPSSGAGR